MAGTQARQIGRLQGKVAIITGAANGIGRATALRFAAEGARLMLNDVNAAALDTVLREVTEAGGAVCGIVGDVAKAAEVERLVAEAVASYGCVDILIANAGIIPEADLPAASADLWDRTMAIDARGMFLCCKHAAAAMLKTGGGAMVLLSSVSGFVGQKGQVVYGPAKFAASGLTKHLAVELAAQGIRVNAVAPGTIATAAVARMDPAGIRAGIAKHPMGRIGQPEEVANAILFLASDEASFITGAILPVDGGFLAQ
ncbi:MAG: SDR family oxidoreductase [Proteobacteria bacterium]|nr:SDR family oxidoreductase [Pseudomonadota bacterium]